MIGPSATQRPSIPWLGLAVLVAVFALGVCVGHWFTKPIVHACVLQSHGIARYVYVEGCSVIK